MFFEYTNSKQAYGKINLGVRVRRKAQILSIRNKKGGEIESGGALQEWKGTGLQGVEELIQRKTFKPKRALVWGKMMTSFSSFLSFRGTGKSSNGALACDLHIFTCFL